MNEQQHELRKRIIKRVRWHNSSGMSQLDILSVATILVTSEAAAHPVDHIFDDQRGPGASRWLAADPGEQGVILEFDTPQTIRRVTLEVEEPEVSRSQEVSVSISSDGGNTYRELIRQEYNFSPPGTAFERENWTLFADGITHFRLWITPDKGGKPCRATVTSLQLQ